MKEDKIDIFNKYCHEINKINNLLIDLDNERLYEIQRKPGIPKCSTMADRLRTEISELLTKINNNEEGMQERMHRAVNSMKF